MVKDNYSKMRSFMAKHAPEKLSVKDLKEDSEARYEQKTKEDARLLELYNQKKLTNKNTIRKAKAIADKYNK